MTQKSIFFVLVVLVGAALFISPGISYSQTKGSDSDLDYWAIAKEANDLRGIYGNIYSSRLRKHIK